ncbi:tryptophan 2,3-dioxygenase family protein [Salsipaludibacter albus]|uniref:tryptophan 2,3-dioxygenase family protein n=1 Tax=Salsipaludibacter albus TaxID=2849650 RepID=UPI001EE47AE3|nr:tryptophan 2,3-dioxygenase family protein [Salsipaludibacter albus]MBY5161016.1 tryptophan 2,3-dioxygenase [Salsipaludibacter albus]
MTADERVYYADYLRLEQLLTAQQPVAGEAGRDAHDELLFIIVHQAYELWFKQVLWELDGVLERFAPDHVDDRDLSRCVDWLERIVAIQKVLVQQLDVLETMTPLDFMDFRDLLTPSSGFQSVQFRLIENRLGLATDTRLSINDRAYTTVLSDEHARTVRAAEQAPTLLERVDAWLARTPFTAVDEFDFWREYRDTVVEQLDRDRAAIRTDDRLSEADRQRQLATQDATRATFESLFDRDAYEELRERGERRLSHEAFVAALMITLYGHEPAMQVPRRLLTALTDIDEGFALWRHRHALMVHRMIGGRVGTGGTSGHDYLRDAAVTHRVFTDLFNLSTFALPRHRLPDLPDDVRRRMGFVHSGGSGRSTDDG